MTHVPDAHGRVNHHPWHIEAEAMKLDGYRISGVALDETALNRTAVVTPTNSTVGTVTYAIDFPSGTYDVGVNYFDLCGGISNYTLYLNDHALSSWLSNSEATLGHEETYFLDGNSNMRKTFYGVNVTKRDEIKVVGVPQGMEAAPLDYVVLLPPGVVD